MHSYLASKRHARILGRCDPKPGRLAAALVVIACPFLALGAPRTALGTDPVEVRAMQFATSIGEIALSSTRSEQGFNHIDVQGAYQGHEPEMLAVSTSRMVAIPKLLS